MQLAHPVPALVDFDAEGREPLPPLGVDRADDLVHDLGRSTRAEVEVSRQRDHLPAVRCGRQRCEVHRVLDPLADVRHQVIGRRQRPAIAVVQQREVALVVVGVADRDVEDHLPVEPIQVDGHVRGDSSDQRCSLRIAVDSPLETRPESAQREDMFATSIRELVEPVDQQHVSATGTHKAKTTGIEPGRRCQAERRRLEPRNRQGGRIARTRELRQVIPVTVAKQRLGTCATHRRAVP